MASFSLVEKPAALMEQSLCDYRGPITRIDQTPYGIEGHSTSAVDVVSIVEWRLAGNMIGMEEILQN